MKKIISVLLAFTLLFVSVGISTTASAATNSNAPTKITLSKTSKTVYIGQKYKLKVKAVTPKKADSSVVWKTSDKKIATVNKNGVVKGKKTGTVTITAVSKINNKIKAKCKITVKKFKKTSIDYNSKISNFDNGLTLIHFNFDDTKHEDPHIIKTYDQLKVLKKRIKKSYDIYNFYDPDSVWYNDEDFKDGRNGDEILKMLDKYNKKFFEKNVLYYNCIDFTEESRYYDLDVSFKCTKVNKNISPNGKLTCYMHVKKSVKKTKQAEIDNDVTVNYNTSVYFIELEKEDIKGVQEFKLKHYEYSDLENLDYFAYPALIEE